MHINIILYILLILNILSFLLGYLYGGIINKEKLSGFIKNNQKEINKTIKSNIAIDDKKVVVNIDTKGLEKKYEELGDKKTTNENISNSINKLKNLKG